LPKSFLEERRRSLGLHLPDKRFPFPDVGVNPLADLEEVREGGMYVGQGDARVGADDFPIRSCPTATSSTLIRCPSIRGLPPHVPGVLTIRTPSAAGSRGPSEEEVFV